MSYGEVRTWIAYRNKWGPMNDVRRYDLPAARQAAIASVAAGGKATVESFLNYGKDKTQRDTPDDILTNLRRQFGGIRIGQRKRKKRG
jgi:hypothetical protein